MKKYIELTNETVNRLTNGKCIKGSLRQDPTTGKIFFRAWQLGIQGSDRIIRQLEHGWLKESPQRIKFFNSVKKDLGCRLVDVTIHRELKTAMTTLVNEEIINRV